MGVGAGGFYRREGPPPGSRPKSSAEVEALGRSRSGLTTKVHAAVDALGNPVHVHLSGRQEADCQQFDQVADALPADVKALVGDKGYDTNAVLARMEEAGAEAVVPAKKNRCDARKIDENLYRDRNKVERFFLQIKQNRAVATRYDKTASSYLAVVELAYLMCWLK